MTTTLETMLAQPDQEMTPDWLDGCVDSRGSYKVVPSVVCSMCCLFGIIYCFFGELEVKYVRACPFRETFSFLYESQTH